MARFEEATHGVWAVLMRGWLAAVPAIVVVGAIGAAAYYGTLAEGALSLSGAVGVGLALAAVGLGISAARSLAAQDALRDYLLADADLEAALIVGGTVPPSGVINTVPPPQTFPLGI